MRGRFAVTTACSASPWGHALRTEANFREYLFGSYLKVSPSPCTSSVSAEARRFGIGNRWDFSDLWDFRGRRGFSDLEGFRGAVLSSTGLFSILRHSSSPCIEERN
jgi:hypothetical protein